MKKDGRRRTGERKKDGRTDGRAGGRKDGRTDGRTADRQAENLGRKEKGDGEGGSFLVGRIWNQGRFDLNKVCGSK